MYLYLWQCATPPDHAARGVGTGTQAALTAEGADAHVIKVIPEQFIHDEQGLSVVEDVQQQWQAFLFLLVHL